MTKKPRFTFAEHADLAKALYEMRNELVRRHVEVAAAYPKSDPAVKKLQAARQAVDQARAALDGALFREHPGEAETTVYYPGQSGRSA